MVISILIGALGMAAAGPFSLSSTGVAFMFITPLFQYFIYEISHPDEYYFYFNMGLSKLVLLICTLVISFCIGLTLILV